MQYNFSFLAFVSYHQSYIESMENVFSCGSKPLKVLKNLSRLNTTLTFMFSVPAMYALKIDCDDCLVVGGVIKSFATANWTLYCSEGLWSIFILSILLCIHMTCCSVCCCAKNSFCKFIIGTMIFFIFLYLVMAFVTKFGYIVILQLPWDISLSINLITDFI